MEQLVARLSDAAGIAPDTAEKAVGAILAFLETHGPAEDVARMVDAIPGGRDAASAGASSSGGGLIGALGGMLGHMTGGDITALGGQLMGLGLDMGQIQVIGRELFAFASQAAGPEVVRRVVDGVPGLGQFV